MIDDEIEPAGQARADRNVRDQSPADRAFEQLPECRRVGRAIRRERAGPEALGADTRVVDLDEGCRRHRLDAVEEGHGGVVEEAVGQVVEHDLLVGASREGRVGEDGLDLRGEHRPTCPASVVERLDPEVVARKHELRRGAALIQDGQAPHPVEAPEGVGTPLRIRLEDDLAVRVGVELPAKRLELGAQLAEVVDLAVVDEVDPAIRRVHRLVPVHEIDDLEPAHAHARGVGHDVATAVRAAMGQYVRHRLEEGPRGRAEVTRNPAHHAHHRAEFFERAENSVSACLSVRLHDVRFERERSGRARAP